MTRVAATSRHLISNYGKSLAFDGATNGVTLTGFKVSTTAFSILFTAKIRNFISNDRIIDQQDSGPANGLTITKSATTQQLTFSLRNSVTNVSNIASKSLNKGQWYRFIAIYEPNSAKFYVDGLLQGSDTSCVMTDSTAVLTIGKRVGGSNFANMLMKDFVVLDRVVTPTEISDYTFNRKIPTSPQVLLDMNENINDTSGNGINGAAVGTLAYSTDVPKIARSAATNRVALKQNYEILTGTLLEGFQTLADWTRQSAAGSIAEDTTNFTYGDKSIRVTFASGTSVFYDKTISQVVDGGSASMMLKVYIPSLTNLESIALYIASISNFSKFFSKTIQATTLHEGFNYIAISPTEWSATGGELWTNTMVRLRIRVNATAGTPAVSFCSIHTKQYNKPKILVTFDDSWDSQYTKGYSYMSTLGLKGTIYCIADKVDTAGYMTTAQCSEIYAAGWDLGTHGNVNLTTLATQALQEVEISSNEAFLTANGFTRSNKHYAYPNGGYNDNARAALAALGYKTARTIINAQQPDYLDEKYLLKRYAIYHTTTVAAATGYIDAALAQGTAILLNFHIIVDADADTSTKVLTATFNSIMDYIKSKKDQGVLDVVTISEWYNGLTNPRLAV